MKDLPSEAQTTIKEKAGNDQILRIAKETRKGKECYEAVVNRDGKEMRSGWTPMASLLALIPRKASKGKGREILIAARRIGQLPAAKPRA